MSVQDSILGRPWPPSRLIEAGFKWQSRVLMPGDQPVLLARLFEQSRAKGHCRSGKKEARDFEQARVVRYPGSLPNPHHMTLACPAGPCPRECADQRVTFGIRKNVRLYRVSGHHILVNIQSCCSG